MKQGYERLYKPISDFEYVYKYKDSYFTVKQIKKLTKTTWLIDPRTKERILTNPDRWIELLNQNIEPFVVAEVAAEHLITTDGELLRRSTLNIVGSKNQGRAIFQEAGGIYDFYRASIVYKKFIDPTFDIEKQECWFIDGDYTNAAIYNLMAKDKSGDSAAARKKAKIKKGTVQRIKDEQEYSY